MKAVVLAAGYATRLRPLTDTVPKQLLPVGGRPILDRIVAKIAEVDEVDGIHVVTNARFAPDFERWATGRDVLVHNDGTISNEDRLGAIGDIRFTVREAGLDGADLLVIAGDNLFEYSLADLVAWWRSKGRASAVALYDCHDRELARQYGVVEVDEDERVVSFVEKPENPASTLAATATYVYHREHAALVERYLAEGNPPDQPGRFVAWLVEREPVYGYRFEGDWFDIGDRAQLLAADNELRRRAGLAERDEYTLSAQS